MGDNQHTYIAIDLKSFFASVECVERGLDPLSTNLVVADASRTEKTICLAVSPSLKQYGIGGRARLFEVIQKLDFINSKRRYTIPNKEFKGTSYSAIELEKHPDWEVSYITATPRMSYYIQYSSKIYNTYLKYVSSDDIHVYSIDEVFIDATKYLEKYKTTAHDLAMQMIKDVLNATGITATAGIGTNLYLCKIAMDIVAKHIPADENGVRIAELDEFSYRKNLWSHQPLTDFWRIGRGVAEKLTQHGIYTMGQIAKCSITDEEFFYKLFGVNAELIIDHAWGWEPCTIDKIKAYKPDNNSFCNGQVLQCAYNASKARIVVQEMGEDIALSLMNKRMVTNQLTLTIGYDKSNVQNSTNNHTTNVQKDRYGCLIPKSSHSSINLEKYTYSAELITTALLELYDRIVNQDLYIRRLNISTNNIVPDNQVERLNANQQLDLFESIQTKSDATNLPNEDEKEKHIQKTILGIKSKYGKNSILKGLNYAEGATGKERNEQIGGHKA